MKRPELYKLIARILLVWSLLSVAGMLWGRYIIELLMPLFTMLTDAVNPYFTPIFTYRILPGGDQLFMTAYVTQLTYVHSALTLNPGATLTDGIDALHILVPLIILYTALISWPVRNWRERAVLVALGIPVALIVSGMTVPFLFTGKIEMMLIDDAARVGEIRNAPLSLYWMIFCESGGRWLIPLVAAALCAVRVRATFRKKQGSSEGPDISSRVPRASSALPDLQKTTVLSR